MVIGQVTLISFPILSVHSGHVCLIDVELVLILFAPAVVVRTAQSVAAAISATTALEQARMVDPP